MNWSAAWQRWRTQTMKMNDRLIKLERRQPDNALARIRAMTDEEIEQRINTMTADQRQTAQELLNQWLK